MSIFEILRENIPIEVFEDQDFHACLINLSVQARYSALSRLLHSHKIIKIRRGLYCFGEKQRKQSLSKYAVAARLYSPSYVSFESALSYHGLIPESVYVTTSVCFQNKIKSYVTPLGDFTFHPIPKATFALGVESLQSKGGSCLMATPLKAFFDIVYQKKKFYSSLLDVEKDLRIEPDNLVDLVRKHRTEDLEKLALSYRKKTCEQLFKVLLKEGR